MFSERRQVRSHLWHQPVNRRITHGRQRTDRYLPDNKEWEECTLRKSRLWSGLTAIMAVLLVVSILGQSAAMGYADVINNALGIQISQLVETGEAGDSIHYKSAFGDFEDPEAQAALLAATFEQNINEMREGAALLYNNEALPLEGETRVSLFGHASVDPSFQSAAAGTKANDGGLNVINLRQALESRGFAVNPTLWDHLKASTVTRNNGAGGGWGGPGVSGSSANTEDPIEYYDSVKSSWANDYNDAAIVVFSRQGAEGTDLKMQDVDDDGVTVMSSLALHQNEKDLLEMVRSEFDKVIVLLNSPNQMEVHEILPYCDAMLYIGMPGHQGFVGVAEILNGTVNPSGKLADTYATSSLSAPATVNSGTQTPMFANVDYINDSIGADENAEYMSFQAEGIYIGYRYYETRYADYVMGKGNANATAGALAGASEWKYENEVQYPFGYGLSYTTFEQTLDKVDVGEDEITVTVTVKNTGDVAGKSVVQVYFQTPYGDYEIANKVEKSAISLGGYNKTKLLAPGETETLTVTVDKYLLASYDYVGVKGYILSEGDYYIAIGDSSHDALNNILAAQGYTTANGMTADGKASNAHTWHQDFDAEKYKVSENGVVVTNQFDDCDINYWAPGSGVYLSRNDWAGTYPVAQTVISATDEMLEILDGEWYEKAEDAPSFAELEKNFGKDSGLTLAMMKDVPYSDKETWRQFISQLEVEDLPAATAESFTCPAVGNLSPAFSVGDGCDSIGGTYPHKVMFNGEETSVPSTRYCSNNIYVGTFNPELHAQRGVLLGEEGIWCKLMINYNVGANLHRTPFGGRNFEYMSECPTMTYLVSILQVTEMEKLGSHAGPKHFCGNDQEFYREGVVVFYNEQAFRETSLRAFEGAIRVANAGGLMQSFERQGLKWTSSSYALNTGILRNEWGWNGCIDTDAAPAFDLAAYVDDSGFKTHSVEVITAGTQEWCLDGAGAHGTAVLNQARETDDGYLLELLTEAAISWEYAISRSNIINGMSATAKFIEITPWWETAIQGVVIGSAVLTVLCGAMLIFSKLPRKKEQ